MLKYCMKYLCKKNFQSNPNLDFRIKFFQFYTSNVHVDKHGMTVDSFQESLLQ